MRNKLSTINEEIRDYLEGYLLSPYDKEMYADSNGKTITNITITTATNNGTERSKYQKFTKVLFPGYIEINYNVQPEEWTYLLKNLYIINDFNMNYNFDAGITYDTSTDTYNLEISNISEIR